MTADLPFHHQTTVVAGLDRLEAEALALEIVAAVGSGRPGLSVDLSTQTGRRLEIHRPLDRSAFVIDADSTTDVTVDFTVSETVHPLEALGVTGTLRMTDRDLVVAERANDRVQRLAQLDQDRLWRLAITLAELEVEVARQTNDAVIGERITPEASHQIEQARTDVELAQQRLEDLSDQWITAAVSLVLISFTVAFITHPLIAIPFMIAAIGVGWRSWRWHQEHEAAISKELIVLEQFGLASYLDFQLRKVDALTNDTKQRRTTLILAEKRRFALEEWRQLVGDDVSLDWAATHRPTIATAAKQAASAVSEIDAAAATEAASLALADRIRQVTAQTEPSPLIVDDIFANQSDAAVERLLWLIDHHCQQLQFVLLSNDVRVLRWAAQRAVARHASILRLSNEVDGDALDLDAGDPQSQTALDQLQS